MTFDFEYGDKDALEKALYQMDRRRSAISRMRKVCVALLVALLSFPFFTGVEISDGFKMPVAVWLLATVAALDAHAPPRVVVYRGKQ